MPHWSDGSHSHVPEAYRTHHEVHDLLDDRDGHKVPARVDHEAAYREARRVDDERLAELVVARVDGARGARRPRVARQLRGGLQAAQRAPNGVGRQQCARVGNAQTVALVDAELERGVGRRDDDAVGRIVLVRKGSGGVWCISGRAKYKTGASAGEGMGPEIIIIISSSWLARKLPGIITTVETTGNDGEDAPPPLPASDVAPRRT